MGAVSGMAQVNVRVDRQVKNRAEEALRLSGASLPELIKKVVAKVAQRQTGFMQIWASLCRPYPTIAIGTQSIPKPWTSAIAKRG